MVRESPMLMQNNWFPDKNTLVRVVPENLGLKVMLSSILNYISGIDYRKTLKMILFSRSFVRLLAVSLYSLEY